MSEQGATAQAKDKAQEVAGQAQEKAQQAAGQARSQLRSQIDDRSTKAGQQVSGHASDLRSVGDSLREQGKEQPAKLADQAADRLERAGSWLTNSDGDRIIHDVEDFARRNPWAVMAGGLAIGFAASRMLKASSTERYQSSRYTPRTLPATTGGYDAGYGPGTGGERFTRPASATTPATTPPVPPTTPTTPAAGPGGI
jgi:ElaB/YqjD/DUF883 family membrane-anchored ribosome-binding protein